MAGTWLSIVQGFGGMRNFDGKLSFKPQIPDQWKSYSFKINYKGNTLKIFKSHTECSITNETGKDIKMLVNNKEVLIPSNKFITV